LLQSAGCPLAISFGYSAALLESPHTDGCFGSAWNALNRFCVTAR
jgi:hypothetical protein